MLLKFQGAGGTQDRIAAPVIEPVFWRNRSQGGALELAVNVALLALFVAPVVRAPLYITAPWKAGTPFEVTQNTAIYAPAPSIQIAGSPEPTFTRRSAPQIDAFPNLAINLAPVVAQIQSSPEPAFTRRAPLQIDVSPNLAVSFQTQVVRGTPEATTPVRRTPAPDLYPNLAVNLQTQTTQQGPEPTYTRKVPLAPELFPNLAALAPVAQIPLVMPVEPWTNRRYPPQVEVFQNQALYAPVAQQTFPAPIEPTYTLRWTVAPDVLPNIAVAFTNIPAPTLIPVQAGHPASLRDLEARLFRSLDQDAFRNPPTVQPEPVRATLSLPKSSNRLKRRTIHKTEPAKLAYSAEITAILLMLM